MEEPEEEDFSRGGGGREGAEEGRGHFGRHGAARRTPSPWRRRGPTLPVTLSASSLGRAPARPQAPHLIDEEEEEKLYKELLEKGPELPRRQVLQGEDSRFSASSRQGEEPRMRTWANHPGVAEQK